MGTIPWVGEGDTVSATLTHDPPGDCTRGRVSESLSELGVHLFIH